MGDLGGGGVIKKKTLCCDLPKQASCVQAAVVPPLDQRVFVRTKDATLLAAALLAFGKGGLLHVAKPRGAVDSQLPRHVVCRPVLAAQLPDVLGEGQASCAAGLGPCLC